MTSSVTWRGTQQESLALTNAVARSCACVYGMFGMRTTTCAPHEMLLSDQRALDGLLFARRIAARLQREEWSE